MFCNFCFVDDCDNEVNGEVTSPPASRRRLSSVNNNNEVTNGGSNSNHRPDYVDVEDDDEVDVPRVNGLTNGFDSDGADDAVSAEGEGEGIKTPPMKELSPEELAEKMKMVHRLQIELQNEEMKLVLLKKLRQSQVNYNKVYFNYSNFYIIILLHQIFKSLLNYYFL